MTRRGPVGSAGRGIIAALSLLLAAGCSEPESGTAERPLVDLVEFAGRYDGRRVITEGRVRTFPDPEHYWIEDDALHRVAIEPAAAVADHVGEHVRVIGHFSHSPTAGRLIRVEAVTRTGGETD